MSMLPEGTGPTPAQLGELEPGVVYLAPSGRRCRLFVAEGLQRAPQPWATLLYELRDGAAPRSFSSNGFSLSRANWSLLVRVG